MTFKVEDGTGFNDSNSYAAVAEADAYFTDRAITAWTGATGVKQAALIRATDYIDQRWGMNFRGSKLVEDQALCFPRDNLYDQDGLLVEGIPNKLKYATAEYALRALSGSLFLEPTTQASGQALTMQRKKVGPIETELRFADSGIVSTTKYYPAADRYLKGYVNISQSNVIRA